MKRVLVTGGAGFLGRAVLAAAPEGFEVHATRRRRAVDGAHAHAVDLAEPDQVDHVLASVRPTTVIHTAYGPDGERDVVAASRNVAHAAARYGVTLVHISTDLVFDGEHAPYAEDARPSPVHDYGRWKAEAERVVLSSGADAAVVRTSLLVSAEPLDATSAWVARGLREGANVRLFVDELRSPIAVDDLASSLWDLARLPVERAGIWHLAGPETVSRYALGLLIAVHQDLDPSAIVAARSADQPDRRPRDVRLSSRRSHVLPTRPRPVSAVFSRERRPDP